MVTTKTVFLSIASYTGDGRLCLTAKINEGDVTIGDYVIIGSGDKKYIEDDELEKLATKIYFCLTNYQFINFCCCEGLSLTNAQKNFLRKAIFKKKRFLKKNKI